MCGLARKEEIGIGILLDWRRLMESLRYIERRSKSKEFLAASIPSRLCMHLSSMADLISDSRELIIE